MADTVQDISFVVQNQQFDFILDLNNEKLDIKEGEVAVPIYFMQQYDLKIGETITVKNGNYKKSFVISDYARDYEMNSSLTSSKRFVLNHADYEEMRRMRAGELEYLIQFKLNENGDAQLYRQLISKQVFRQTVLLSEGKSFYYLMLCQMQPFQW